MATAAAREAEMAAQLTRTWGRPAGLWGWLCDVRHQSIGLRVVVTAFVFFLLGGLEALLMRLQLARPEGRLLSADLYNQLFTTHGSTMMFLFAVPVFQGIGLYLVPLMIGTRDLAFPRLAAFSYWLYLIGGLLLYAGLFTNTAPDAGWFSYVPLSGPGFSPGKRVDVWAQMITFTELSSLGFAVNTICTVFKQRAPGMSLDRIPLFVWAQLVTAFMIIFSMPAVMLASGCLALDRLVGTHFFNSAEGGDALLWQHLFWFFAHPEVYIIFIPALGIVSAIVATTCRRQVFGYQAMVLALVATGFIGFGLWVHHMFATGLPQLGASFFTAASIMIAIPTGIQMFCWIGTIWTGTPRWTTSFLFVVGFVATFMVGGLTGVMLASVPLNWQVHDTFFVVAHLHYVLIGGSVFPLFGAVHFWFPKVTGRLMSETLGKWTFALVMAGFHLTFFPQHQLGLRGMPRRVYTYGAELGWGRLNLLSTVGAAVLGAGVLLLLINVVRSARRGALAGCDPWGGDTLEWATSSPPPVYGFAELPTVNGRAAMWTRSPSQPVVAGLSTRRAELLVTRLLDAVPDHRAELPGASVSPLLAAIAFGGMFVGAIFTPWAVPVGAAVMLVPLATWFWPHPPHKSLAEEQP